MVNGQELHNQRFAVRGRMTCPQIFEIVFNKCIHSATWYVWWNWLCRDIHGMQCRSAPLNIPIRLGLIWSDSKALKQSLLNPKPLQFPLFLPLCGLTQSALKWTSHCSLSGLTVLRRLQRICVQAVSGLKSLCRLDIWLSLPFYPF